MNACAAQRVSESPEVARLEAFSLCRLGVDTYQLHGPDACYSRAWVRSHLPAGDWYSEWSGDSELVVTFTRL